MSIGLESLQNLKIRCVESECLILSSENIEGNFKFFAIIPEKAFLISLLFSVFTKFLLVLKL